MMRTIKNRATVFLACAFASGLTAIYAQDSADKASQALDAASLSDAESAFFGDEEAVAEAQAADAPSGLDKFLKSDEGVRWGGRIDTDLGWTGGWTGTEPWPEASDLSHNWNDGFVGSFDGSFYLDARPEKSYRAKLALKTAWPFAATAAASPDATDSVDVPNVKVWEMFADVNVDDLVFVRIGKQVASWGLLGSAYSPSDVISLTPKDVTDLGAEREGPVALKLNLPVGALNGSFSGLVIAREDYLGSKATWRDLGYALKAEFLHKYTEIGLGAFYQRQATPKLVGTLTSGLGYFGLPFVKDVNLFSESALSWGSDKRIGSGTTSAGTFASLEKPDEGFYYLGTIGASYANSDYNYTISVEYFYNGLGSDESDYAGRAFATLKNPALTSGGTLDLGDVLGPGMNNLTAILSLTEINRSKFASTTIWQQNASDGSGWVREKITYTPRDYVSFYAGAEVVYGGSGTEFALLHSDGAGDTRRLTLFAGTTIGTGSF